MITNEQIKTLCSRLRLYALPRLLESEAHLAQEQGKNHVEFLHDLLSREVQERDSKDFQRRLKAAALPARRPRPFRPQLLARYNRTKIA